MLVLETTPRFDTTALRRWFEQAGGTLVARTQIGKDLYRFFGPAGEGGSTPPEFTAVDATLLARFDLVLADGRALLALKDEERSALRGTVTDTGLGVLALADDTVLSADPAAAKSPAAFLLPWTLRLVNGGEPAPENADRNVRLRWPGLEPPMGTLVGAAPWEINLREKDAPLVRDDQGRVLAASARLGRGQLALTVVRETDRWTRANDPTAFAAYWSHLFSQVARRTGPAAVGRWRTATPARSGWTSRWDSRGRELPPRPPPPHRSRMKPGKPRPCR